MRKVKAKEDAPKKARNIAVNILRLVIIAVCANFMGTFIFTMQLNIINPGNAAGCVFCGAVILLTIFYPLMKRKKPLRIAGKVMIAGLAVFFVYCAVIAAIIGSEMLRSPAVTAQVSTDGAEEPQTVIVLGCKTIDGEPSPMLAMRLEKALEYMNAHPAAVCVVSGGQGGNETEPEAETMYLWLTANGVEPGRLYKEPASANTTENIRNSAALIAAERLPTDVVIVSENYHIYRGVRQAKLAGLNAAGIYPDPAPVMVTQPSYWLREIFAVTRDYVFG